MEISAKTKAIAAKQPLTSEDAEYLKKEIVKYTKWYLSLNGNKNSIADLSGIIQNDFKVVDTNYPFERDIGGRMMRTKDYIMVEMGGDRIRIIPTDRDWWDKYSFWVSLGLLVFGYALGLFSDPIKNAIISKRPNSDTLL